MRGYHPLVVSEVRKALRRHPRWKCYAEDLYQDAEEARLRAGDVHPAKIRLWIRGALVRAGLSYFQVAEKTGLTPRFCSLAVPVAVVDSGFNALEAKLTLWSLMQKAQPVARRALELMLDGATLKDAAAECDISRNMLYGYEFPKLRRAA